MRLGKGKSIRKNKIHVLKKCNTSQLVSNGVLKSFHVDLCDKYEIVGGCDNKHNT